MSENNTQNNSGLFDGWAFGKINYILFSVGLALVIFGYIFGMILGRVFPGFSGRSSGGLPADNETMKVLTPKPAQAAHLCLLA